MASGLDLNKLLVLICLITNGIVSVAAIINMVNINFFSYVIIQLYVLVVSVLIFASDIQRPLLCGEWFAFLKFYWGRFLTYLLFGALVFQDSFEFAGAWTWAICGIFGVLALFAAVDKNQTLPPTLEPLTTGAISNYRSGGNGPQNRENKHNITSMSSSQAYA